VRFTLAGTGTLVPDGERGSAGFLLQDGGTALLVDGGSGTIQRLARSGFDARFLDGGVYSHRHLDHCGDLPALLFTLGYSFDMPRSRDYPIWAGQGFPAMMTGIGAAWGKQVSTGRFAVPIVELPLSGPGHAELPGGILLDTLPANHEEGALHLRFTGRSGATVVFSGDTGPSENLVKLARGVDLLVCECALPEGHPYPLHLAPSHVAALVDAARPRQVRLTHFYLGTDPEAAVALVASTRVSTSRGFDGESVLVGPARSR
jgi:ribonuclease BN (tRNA processing enzyme)